MRFESKDSLIEVTVRQSVEELRGIRYGRDVAKGELPVNTRILGNGDDWGLVYDTLDLEFTKQVVKIKDDPSWDDFGIVVGRESELDIYVVLLEGSTVKLSRLELDDEDHSIDSEEVYASSNIDNIEGFGLTAIRKGNAVEVYAQTDVTHDYPHRKVLEGNIPSRAFEGAFGMIGWSAEISTWFLKHLLIYGRNSSYTDYSLNWDERGGWDGSLDYIPSRGEKLYYNSGNQVDVYIRPFRRAGIGNDLYGDLDLAFSGFIEDIDEVGLPDSDRYKIMLKGNRHNVDREENVTVLEDIDEQNRDVTLRDYYDLLEDLYGLVFDINSFSDSDPVDIPPLLNVDGSLKDAEERLLIEQDKQVRITPVQEGIKYDIDVYGRGEGENRTVRSEDLAESEDEAIIEDINLEVEIGKGNYFNKFVSKAKIDDERWRIMRENRYDKFFGDEVDMDVTKEDNLPYAVEDLALQSDLTEDFIDMQNLRMKANLTLVGQHHYLAGSSRQGTLTIGHQSKALEDVEFFVEEMTLDPDGTQIVASEAPNMQFKERVEEVKEEVRIEDISDVFDSLEEQRIEVKVDEPIGFDAIVRREETVSEIRLLDPAEDPLTKWVGRVHQSYFRGYVWIDSKVKSDDLELDGDDSVPTSNYRRAKYILVRTLDESRVQRQYKIEISDFYSHASWLLPKSYNIIDYDVGENTITIGGDVSDRIRRMDDLEVIRAGDADGSYTIEGYSVDGGNTVVEVEDVESGVDSGRVELEDETELYINLAIQQPLGLRQTYIGERQLVLGHALGGLGYEGRFGHATELDTEEIVRDWSKNIYITDGIE